MARTPARRTSLLLVLGATGVAFLAGEIALRIVGIAHPRPGEYDPEIGSQRRPGIEWHHTREGNAHVRINSQGFRDREHPREKPPDTVRIAVLGDSQVEAWQVEPEERWTELVERELRARGLPATVMNFGISGYGTAEELLLLRRDVLPLDPDVVVLAFLTGNDVQNNHEALQMTARRPYFLLEDGQLVLDTSFREAMAYRTKWWRRLVQRAIDHSRLLQVAFEAKSKWDGKKKKAAFEPLHHVGRKIFLEEPGLHAAVYREPESGTWKEAWAVTEAIVSEMRREVDAIGGRFLLVTLTNPAQVYPDRSVRREFEEYVGVEDLFYPDRRLAALAEREGFRAVDLAAPLQARADSTGEFFHGFENTTMGKGHWNELGHRVAAGIVAGELAAMLGSGQ